MDLVLVAREILKAPADEAHSIWQAWEADADEQMNSVAIQHLPRIIVQAVLKYDNGEVISSKAEVYAALRRRTMSIAANEDRVNSEASKVSELAGERSLRS